MTVVLVLGGARSGKSRYAERLLTSATEVFYVAPGPTPDAAADPGWAARVEAHRTRRPASWRTVETPDVPGAVRHACDAAAGDGAPAIRRAVMIDCLGTWLTRILDDACAWDDRVTAEAAAEAATADLLDALATATLPVVLVSNEVGAGVIPAHRAGRVFRDLLGRLNASVAEVCDHVALVVAGRVLDLSSAPTVSAAPTYDL